MSRWLFLGLFLLSTIGRPADAAAQGGAKTWAERLGWPSDKRVLILHADDVGMCYEANASAQRALTQTDYRSAALMVPCPWFGEMVAWTKEHPNHDLGLHLALTSEWKLYRWGPVAPPDQVKGLIDPFGYLFPSVAGVTNSASAAEIAAELRAQFNRARTLGLRPTHVDTHMGTLYARPDYTRAYLKLATDEQVPAMVIEMTPQTLAKFRGQGYPLPDETIKMIADYPLPKLDDFHAIGPAPSYVEKRQKLFEQVRALPPGLHELIFHPAVQTEGLKRITNSWQQRVWEDRLLADPQVRQFWAEQGIVVTDWKEVMARFKQNK